MALGCTVHASGIRREALRQALRGILRHMSGAGEFYDHDDVLTRYLKHRSRPDNPNDAIERPIFLELVGNVGGLDIVDLGCGDAAFGREALDSGASSFNGIEVSQRMVDLARKQLGHPAASIEHLAIEQWLPPMAEADLVTSRLALQYVEDLSEVFRKVSVALRPGGERSCRLSIR